MMLLATLAFSSSSFFISLRKTIIHFTTIRRSRVYFFSLIAPAPFTLCDLDDLDLRRNQKYCPPDRSALAAFYSSTLGTEWLRNDNWVSGDVHHCFWYGVTCDCGEIDCSESNDIGRDFEKVIALNLTSNGVAGRFPPEFFSIKTLQLLDLTDNDIRGEVPSLIGTFTDLRFLRLSYNRITALPKEMKNLTKLTLVHLQSNRLSGSGSVVRLADPSQGLEIVPELPEHKYVADCGDPQDASEPFVRFVFNRIEKGLLCLLHGAALFLLSSH